MNNTVILIGRICNDLELRTTQNGTNVLKLNLAIPRNYKNSQGEYDTDFINCTLYRQIADRTAEYCRKGDMVGIKGTIQTGSYEKDGKKVYTTEVVAEKITFLQSKSSGQAPKEQSQAEILSSAMNEEDPFANFQTENEDELNNLELPF